MVCYELINKVEPYTNLKMVCYELINKVEHQSDSNISEFSFHACKNGSERNCLDSSFQRGFHCTELVVVFQVTRKAVAIFGQSLSAQQHWVRVSAIVWFVDLSYLHRVIHQVVV